MIAAVWQAVARDRKASARDAIWPSPPRLFRSLCRKFFPVIRAFEPYHLALYFLAHIGKSPTRFGFSTQLGSFVQHRRVLAPLGGASTPTAYRNELRTENTLTNQPQLLSQTRARHWNIWPPYAGRCRELLRSCSMSPP